MAQTTEDKLRAAIETIGPVGKVSIVKDSAGVSRYDTTDTLHPSAAQRPAHVYRIHSYSVGLGSSL